MLTIPTQSVVSQSLSVTLSNQACQISIYSKQRFVGALPYNIKQSLYLDLYVSNSLVIGGVRCLNAVRIVRDYYLGFSGDIAFYDTQGTDDPIYSGLGSRFQLIYFNSTELAAPSV